MPDVGVHAWEAEAVGSQGWGCSQSLSRVRPIWGESKQNKNYKMINKFQSKIKGASGFGFPNSSANFSSQD